MLTPCPSPAALLATLAAAALSAGCYKTKGVRPDQVVNPQMAYLYGRFYIKRQVGAGEGRLEQTIGLEIGCSNQSKYTFWFDEKRDVQVIQLPPLDCHLSRVIYASGDINPYRLADPLGESRDAPPATWDWNVRLAPGRAYYLGDYFARGAMASDAQYNHWSWQMSPADDRYESTTADFKRTFPALASLPTEAKQLAPRAPAPKRGGMAADTPPLPPERIARIAPFTKRSYATPAQCEAACKTGQCLPYRGPTGAAMTCIVHCKADKDCPRGLACNCPTGDGVDCRPVASTPEDPMAGICLAVEAAPEPSPQE